jgi:hypothetical protein
MSDLETRVNQWFDVIAELSPDDVEARRDVELVITKLDDGQLRVAEIGPDGTVIVHETSGSARRSCCSFDYGGWRGSRSARSSTSTGWS